MAIRKTATSPSRTTRKTPSVAAKRRKATPASSTAKAGAKLPKTAPKTVPKAAAASPAATKSAPITQPAAPSGKVKKPKLVRDSFSMPKEEYAQIDALKIRSARLGHPVKKSEVLRAGVKLLLSLNDAALLSALAQIPSLKTGRPKSAK